MPQPESCSSAWWINGLSASRRSWRTEIGSAATQPNTRHMTGANCRSARASQSTYLCERSRNDGAKTDLVGPAAQAVRAGAAGRGWPEPPAGAPEGRDRVPEGGGRAPRDLADADAPQHQRVSGRRIRG